MQSTSATVSVAICSPQPIVRAGLREIVSREHPFHVLETPSPLEQAIAWIEDTRPDILLYEGGSATETFAVLDAIKHSDVCTRTIILLKDFVEEFVIRIVQQGAFGCLLERASPEELLKALSAVHAGELWLSRSLFAKVLNCRPKENPDLIALRAQLTPRQHQIVELVSRGMANKEIAARLLITEATVRAHVNDIFKKVGLRHRVQLAVHFARNNHFLTALDRAKVSN